MKRRACDYLDFGRNDPLCAAWEARADLEEEYARLEPRRWRVRELWAILDTLEGLADSHSESRFAHVRETTFLEAVAELFGDDGYDTSRVQTGD